MRIALAAAALLLAGMIAVVPASAQGGERTTLTDAEYDVEPAEFCFLVVPSVCTEHLDPKADLVRIDVHDDGTTLTIELATRVGDDVTLSEGQQYRTFVNFLAGGLSWQLRADHNTNTPGFQLWQMAGHEGGSLGGGEGFSGFEHSGLLTIEAGSEPWAYTVGIRLSGLLVPGITRLDRISDLHAVAYAYQSGSQVPSQASTQDFVPDEGPRPEHRLAKVVARIGTAADGAVQQTSALVWSTAEGTDFAGGPSVAVGPNGPAVAYYVYRDERGAETGIYYATGNLQGQRIADYTQPGGDQRDRVTRTHLAFAGDQPVVLFAPAPWTGAGFRVATLHEGSWTVVDPAAGLGLSVVDGHRHGAALAASPDRTVVALPLAGDRIAIVEATDLADDGWRLITTLDEARLPKLALDGGGAAHLASFQVGPDDGRGSDRGWLRYASEAGGWNQQRLVEGVEDRTGFWDTAETDGSYAMALRGDTPCFAWDSTGSRDGEQAYGCLARGKLGREPAPFEPVHGNTQLTMRLAFDGQGHAYVASGYGGLDLVARRSADGGWSVHDVDRRDMFDLAVAPDGTQWMAYTQPHGGTTVALSSVGPGALAAASADVMAAGPRQDEATPAPGVDAPALPLAALVATLALAMLAGRRR